MKLIAAATAVLALYTEATLAAYCHGSPDAGERVNDMPIFDEEPRFVRSVKNAMLFEAGPPNASFPIVHVWGNPYQVGFAQGTLMKEYLTEFVHKTWKYLREEILDAAPADFFPEAARNMIVQKGMDFALDWTVRTTAPFTSKAFYEEVRGMSDATGLPYDYLYRLQMFPELTKASCSFMGAWGTAVSKEGHTYQLRSLDYDTVGPFKDYPQLTIYHPTDGGHAYAQVGWPGNVGSLSGFSSQQIAISEIGVSFPDDSFGQGTDNTPPEKVHGQPWMYLLRDVLQFDTSLEEAKKRVAEAPRTCNLIIGLGDGDSDTGAVTGVQYSGYVSNFYNDENMLPVNETWHPVVKDVVYNGMDWNCPAYTEVLGEQLGKYHGSIDEEVMVRNVLPTVQSGDLHSVVYDLTDSLMHISFCRSSTADESEPQYAYERQFTRLHMQDVFAQLPPSTVDEE